MNKLIFILLIASFGAYAQVSSGVANITEVKLFRNMAELNHEVELNIKRGANDYYIDSIAKTIDISTFLLNSDESLRILSTNYFGNEMDSALYNKIKDSIDFTDLEIKKAKNIHDINKLQIELYTEYSLNLANLKIKVSPLELNQISKEVKSKLKEIDIKFDISEKKLDSLIDYKNKLEEKLDDVERKRNFLKIRIYSEKDTKSKLAFSYIAYKAGWDLAYDMFLNEYEDKARLESKAIVNQTTGLDWTNTKLQIINSKPDMFKFLDLNAYVLDNSNNHKTNAELSHIGYGTLKGTVFTPEGKPAVGATIQVIGTVKGTFVKSDGSFMVSNIEAGEYEVKVSFVGMEVEIFKIILKVNETKIANIKMKDWATTEAVMVMADREMVQADAIGKVNTFSNQLDLEDGYTKRGSRNNNINEVQVKTITPNDEYGSALGGVVNSTTNSNVDDETSFAAELKVYDKVNEFNKYEWNIASEKITDEKFAIEDRVDIPNGTSGKIVRFESKVIKVEVFAKAVPIISKNTYLIVEVPNFKKYNMEGVTISKYHNGIFKGNGILALPRPNTGQLNFGIEKNIIVERKTVRDYTDSKIFSSRKTTEFEYEFNVKNNYSDRLNLRIDDRVPVIKDDSYELEMLDLIGWEKDSYGIVTWKVNLEPNEQITKKLKFNVTHPGNAVIRK